MKKKIILSVVIVAILYQMYKFYIWIIKERKKHRNKVIGKPVPKETPPVDKCIKHPMNTAPDSIYEGVHDKETFNIIKTAFYIIIALATVYTYYN